MSRSAGLRFRATPTHHWVRWIVLTVCALIVIVVIFGAVQLAGGTPSPKLSGALPASLTKVPEPPGGALPWPTTGEAGMEIPGVVTFPPVGPTSPVPIASITKLMTTLVLLKDHPLQLGQQGPTITVTAPVMTEYAADVANHDSLIPLTLGEQLTEFQAVEAMLVPSADDVAQLVAQWDAGSEAAFVAKMNAQAKSWGMTGTTFADVSGVSSGSVSTVPDLLELGQKAMANPVIRSVVALPSVTLPGSATPDPTYNFALDEDGIVGIKTGSDGAAGGCFLFAANVKVDGSYKLVYGVVLGQQSRTSTLDKALSVSTNLIVALRRVLAGITLLHTGQRVGELRPAWTSPVPLETTGGVTVIAAPGTPVKTSLRVVKLPSGVIPSGFAVGQLVIHAGLQTARVDVVTTRSLSPPSLTWRLFHG